MTETWHTCVVCGYLFYWTPQPDRRRSNTCSPECRRIRHAQKNEESRQRAVARGCPPDKHGTATGYSYFKCTCVRCRKWASEYTKERRRRMAVSIRVREYGQTKTLTGRSVASIIRREYGCDALLRGDFICGAKVADSYLILATVIDHDLPG